MLPLPALALALAQGIPLPLPVQRPFVPEGRPLEGLVITVDPGHGGASHSAGYTGSARGVQSRYPEQDLNLRVSLHLANLLRLAGAEVHLTRADDSRSTLNPLEGPPTSRSEELGARVKVAAESASHLFLAVHHNSFSNPSAHGVVVLIWPTDRSGADQPLERVFADVLREEVEAMVPKGRRYSHYLSQHPLVTFSDQPSAVIEFGFLSNPEFDRWVTAPGNTRTEAVAVYRAIERLWRERRTELEAKRVRLFPAAASIPRAPEPTQTERLRAELLRDGPEKALERYAERVRAAGGWLSARLKREGERWRIEGECSHPRIAEFALSLLPEGAENALRSLDEPEPMVAAFPTASVWRDPKRGSGLVDQALLGETVWRRSATPDGSFLLVQTRRGAFGWVRRDALEPLGSFGRNLPRVRVAKETLADDFRLPVGAELPLVRREGGLAVVALPRGVRGTGQKPEARVPAENLADAAEHALGEAAARAAAPYQGSPVLEGGRSEQGIGNLQLAELAWRTVGVVLPNDPESLAKAGSLVPKGQPLLAGDLLVFLGESGLPDSVGVSLGGARFLIAASPEVQVCSLDPEDPVFDADLAARLAFARRP
ncbi:MAG: N-acetylmuramoyl-L-alanine amidase [Fimbriimonadales bacterium]|nr:N-acetylmuramoyl-L-alanine amidase [Fimbriimonadales bacterium]